MTARILACGIAALCLIGPGHAGSAQADEAGVWLEAGARLELTDRIDFDLSQHLRFDEEGSRVASVMPEAKLGIELHEMFEIGTGYRYEYERRDGQFEGGHRVHGDATVEGDLGPIELGYRVRLQDRVGDSGGERLRHRAQLAWKRKGWDPYASAETFHDLESGIPLRKTRFTAGIEMKLWDQDVETYYRLELPKDYMEPLLHIVGLELRTDL